MAVGDTGSWKIEVLSHENRTSEFVESRLTRLEYVGNRRFNAYVRHTRQWWEILEGVTLEGCFGEIGEQQLLHP